MSEIDTIMFKYIYYRLCKHHEKGKRLNTRTCAASNFAGVMHFMMIWPLAWIFIALLTLICSNPLVCLLAFIPFIIWSEFLTGRFEKRMETYKPPRRYKGLNRISVGWFIAPLFLLVPVYLFSVIVLIFKIVPSYLERLMTL